MGEVGLCFGITFESFLWQIGFFSGIFRTLLLVLGFLVGVPFLGSIRGRGRSPTSKPESLSEKKSAKNSIFAKREKKFENSLIFA
jgi:hypothetical protein